MPRFPTFLVLALVFAGVPSWSFAAEPEDKQSALAIFDAALVQFEISRAALSRWQYHQTLTTRQFDASGNVVGKGTWRSIVRPGDSRPLEYTSKSTEGKLSFFEAGSEESPSGEPTPSAKAKSDAENNQIESAVEAVRKYNLRNRYVWKRLPDEQASGEQAYVLSFQPKARQNTSSREERFFGLLAGRLWISRQDFSVLKAQASLQSPCQLFWILARVTTFQLNYELRPAQAGNRLLRSSRANATTVVAFPFVVIRQRHWHTAERYEPRTPRRQTPSN